MREREEWKKGLRERVKIFFVFQCVKQTKNPATRTIRRRILVFPRFLAFCHRQKCVKYWWIYLYNDSLPQLLILNDCADWSLCLSSFLKIQNWIPIKAWLTIEQITTKSNDEFFLNVSSIRFFGILPRQK